MLLLECNHECELGAYSDLGLANYVATQLEQNLPRNVQTEADPLSRHRLRLVIHLRLLVLYLLPRERRRQQLEKFSQLLLAHTDPIVLHLDLEQPILALLEKLREILLIRQIVNELDALCPDLDEAATVHVLEGVGVDIEEHLLDPVAVNADA